METGARGLEAIRLDGTLTIGPDSSWRLGEGDRYHEKLKDLADNFDPPVPCRLVSGWL